VKEKQLFAAPAVNSLETGGIFQKNWGREKIPSPTVIMYLIL
jgi:hypothetical protein